LAGLPIFAGYYSKDAILEAAFSAGSAAARYGFVCGVAAAFLTAFYSWRLLFMTFHGEPRAEAHVLAHVHESPPVMTVPLGVLSLGAIFAGMGFRGLFIGSDWPHFWRGSIVNAAGNNVLEAMEKVPATIGTLPVVMGILGIALAYAMYIAMPLLPNILARTFRPVYLFLLNKWYFDELYDAIFVRPGFALARMLWQVADATIIDGVPNGVASLATESSAQAVKLQTGSIAVYAFTMLIGLVALLSIFLLLR